MSFSFTLSEQEKKVLTRLVHWSIDSGLEGVDMSSQPLDDIDEKSLCVPRACFVTLYLDKQLRGCIGTLLPREALYKNVIRMAHAAAFSDPRFPPLSKAEWARTICEVSVLGPMSPCPDSALVEIGRHGLLLQKDGHSGVFLPHVPVEAGWNLLEYLDHLCLKAALPKGAWRESSAQLFWFESYVFSA